MKNTLLIFFCVAIAFTGNAQIASRKQYINPAQVLGVYNFGKYPAALSNEGVRGTDQTQLYTLHFLTKGVSDQEIDVPSGSYIFDVETSASNNVIIFNGRKEVTLVKVNQGEQPVYTTIETAPNFNFYGINSSAMDQNGNMVLVRGYAENGFDADGRSKVISRGIEYIHILANGTVTQKRLEKIEDKKAFSLVNIFPTKGGMVYLMEHNYRKESAYELKLVMCDLNGNVSGEYTLSGDQTFFPSDILNDNGKLIIAGYYLNGTIYTAKKTEGLFLTIMEPDGTVKAKNTFDWSIMKTKLKNTKRSDFVFSGKMNVMVEKIAVTETGYGIICESYSTGSGITGAELLIGGNSGRELVLTVYDFILFDTDANGSLLNVNILEKEASNIEMAGSSKNMGIVQMTSLLKKFNVLPFRGYDNGIISFINYKAKKGFYSTLNTGTGELSEGKSIDLTSVKTKTVDKDAEAFIAGSSALSKLDRMSSNLDKFADKTENAMKKLEYGIEKVDVVFSPYAKSNEGLFILSDGKVLSYKMDQDDYSIYYDFLN